MNDAHLTPTDAMIEAGNALASSVEELVTPLERASADLVSRGKVANEGVESAFDRARNSIANWQAALAQQQPSGEVVEVQAEVDPVLHWYQSDEHHPRPLAKIVRDIVADLQTDRAHALALSKVLQAADTLSFCAQTTGGTAGRDGALVAAIESYSTIRDAALAQQQQDAWNANMDEALKAAIEALQWYAEPVLAYGRTQLNEPRSAFEADKGRRARAALEKIGAPMMDGTQPPKEGE